MLDINKSQEIAEFMRAHHHYGGERFAEALNEIEHLQIKLEETRRDLLKAKTNNQCFKRLIKKQSGEIEKLKDDLETAKASPRFDREEIERLRARDKQNAAAIVAMADGAKQYVLSTHAIIKVVFDEADSLVDYCEKLEKIVIAKDARIQELKDAHKRSGAKYAKIINELRSSVYANTPGLKKQWDEILNTPAEAIRQLDVKPRSWKITDEQEEALHVMGNMKTLIVCPHCKTPIEFADIPKYTAVLRAMLKEVEG